MGFAMVDTILMITCLLSLVIWFVQEKKARPQLQQKLNALIAGGQQLPVEQLQTDTNPPWNQWLFKFTTAIWIGWAASVILLKDGDFAFILVMLTFLSGVITGLDKLFFAGARKVYIESKAVADYLQNYSREQRESLTQYFAADMVIGEYAKSFFPILAFVLVLRSFVIEPFQIPSGSMMPTLQVGDYILVNKYTYGLRLPVVGTKIVEVDQPKRGDAVVFFPPHQDIYFIKRVIGLPGDQVTYKNKVLSVNGKVMEQTLLAELPPLNPQMRMFTENLQAVEHLAQSALHRYTVTPTTNQQGDFSITVKPGHYWVMGDNRDNSADSRSWGQVPEERLVGKAFAIWLHWPTFFDIPTFSRMGAIQ